MINLKNELDSLENSGENILEKIEPFMFNFLEFVPFENELATNSSETQRSTGTAGREDDYDEP